MSLAKYASLRRLKLLTGADFNEKMREKGVPKPVSVQKICRLAKNEDEVRESIDTLWREPGKAVDVLIHLRERNQELYRFEEMLKGKTMIEELETGLLAETAAASAS
jgi:hypothetical protein